MNAKLDREMQLILKTGAVLRDCTEQELLKALFFMLLRSNGTYDDVRFETQTKDEIYAAMLELETVKEEIKKADVDQEAGT